MRIRFAITTTYGFAAVFIEVAETLRSCSVNLWSAYMLFIQATFRLQYEDDYEYEFSVLSTRFKFGRQIISKRACSKLETRTRSRPRTPIWRSQIWQLKPKKGTCYISIKINEKPKSSFSFSLRVSPPLRLFKHSKVCLLTYYVTDVILITIIIIIQSACEQLT